MGLKNLDQYRGKMDGHVFKLCDDYALDVLGNRRYAPWLYLYAAVSGEFKEGWIPITMGMSWFPNGWEGMEGSRI